MLADVLIDAADATLEDRKIASWNLKSTITLWANANNADGKRFLNLVTHPIALS
jgi:hypothetical protein